MRGSHHQLPPPECCNHQDKWITWICWEAFVLGRQHIDWQLDRYRGWHLKITWLYNTRVCNYCRAKYMYRIIQPALLVSCTSIQYKSTNKIEWQHHSHNVHTILTILHIPSSFCLSSGHWYTHTFPSQLTNLCVLYHTVYIILPIILPIVHIY